MDERPADRAALGLGDRFEALTGWSPEGIWQAPGRVNLIGEHTDYNSGFALPFAIDRQTVVALRRRQDRRVRVWSSSEFGHAEADLDELRDFGGSAESGGIGGVGGGGGVGVGGGGDGGGGGVGGGGVGGGGIGGGGVGGGCGGVGCWRAIAAWARYPIGVLWAFGQAGADLPGFDAVIASTVPAGRGLSSSAALEAAVAVAVNDVCRLGLARRDLGDLCHRAETDFVGAPVGLLDQLAVFLGRRGHGLFIDFRSLDVALQPLAIGPLVVVDTQVRHSTADGGYASRRRDCQRAAEELGVPSLREATLDMVGRLSGDPQRRARHVVTENQRVVDAARRLQEGSGIGDLLFASHASLRDDFDVSCPELDLVVATAGDAGASGARLTGAGFGGCAIVLGLDAGALAAALAPGFQRVGWRQPDIFIVLPADGAGRLV